MAQQREITKLVTSSAFQNNVGCIHLETLNEDILRSLYELAQSKTTATHAIHRCFAGIYRRGIERVQQMKEITEGKKKIKRTSTSSQTQQQPKKRAKKMKKKKKKKKKGRSFVTNASRTNKKRRLLRLKASFEKN